MTSSPSLCAFSAPAAGAGAAHFWVGRGDDGFHYHRYSSLPELLLPKSVKECKALLRVKIRASQISPRELGDKATYQGIKNAGHLVHMERPCVYNRFLSHFLASLPPHDATK